MPIDCYVSSCASDAVRTHLARATLACLMAEPLVSVVLLRTEKADVHTPFGSRATVVLKESKQEFQRARRREAAERALTAVYVCADDDVLPLSANWVMLGLEAMEKHREFGLIGLRANGIQYLAEDGFKNEVVEERGEAGGLYFTRRGILKREEWPDPKEFNDYDRRVADTIRAKGLKVGMFNHLYFSHIGLGYSTATHNQNGYKEKA